MLRLRRARARRHTDYLRDRLLIPKGNLVLNTSITLFAPHSNPLPGSVFILCNPLPGVEFVAPWKSDPCQIRSLTHPEMLYHPLLPWYQDSG